MPTSATISDVGENQKTMDVSVVIPCRNGAATLARQLEALREQIADATFEVVVADNGSTDDSAALARSWDSDRLRVRVADASAVPGINHARNTGVTDSSGQLVLFCDADDRVHQGWVDGHWQAFRSGARLLGGSLVRVFADGRSALALESGLNSSLGYLSWPSGANCGVAREVFDRCGLFDESLLGGGDETEFFWRAQNAGYELTFVPQAQVDYVQREEPTSLFAQQKAYGRSHVKLYAMFRRQGMPRAKPLSGLWGIGTGVLRRVFSRPGSERREISQRTLGLFAGRISESWRQRVWYV
jgi:glycosyltransferase involved in cell wall biosynthesis